MSDIKNSYPLLPEIPFQPTFIEMPNVVIYGKTKIGEYDKEIVKMAYIIFRIEGANGLKGVNNNYIGLQADTGAWEGLDLTHVVGTCVKKDSGYVWRRFICFDNTGAQSCFDFLCYKIKERGMYIGADNVNTVHDLTITYKLHWNGAQPQEQDFVMFDSLYNSATKVFG
jgi:hypothetical protein